MGSCLQDKTALHDDEEGGKSMKWRTLSLSLSSLGQKQKNSHASVIFLKDIDRDIEDLIYMCLCNLLQVEFF